MDIHDYWHSVIDFTDFISNVAVALAAMATAYFGYKGINIWKKEIHGKYLFNISVELLNELITLHSLIVKFRDNQLSHIEFNQYWQSEIANYSDQDIQEYEEENEKFKTFYQELFQEFNPIRENFETIEKKVQLLFAIASHKEFCAWTNYNSLFQEFKLALALIIDHLAPDIDCIYRDEIVDARNIASSFRFTADEWGKDFETAFAKLQAKVQEIGI